jgi:hypothetical protein
VDLAADAFDLGLAISTASSSYNRYQRDLAGAPKWENCSSGTGTMSVCGKVGKRKEVNPRYSAASIQKSSLPRNKS